MSRTSFALLSEENLLSNIQNLRSYAPNSGLIAMVKANAYGHGLRSVAQRIGPYVSMLGVAFIDEALALRKAGVTSPILLSEGVFEKSELLIASAERFEVVFHSKVQLDWLNASYLTQPIKAWIKVNTGISRLGFSLEEGEHVYQALLQNSFIQKPLGLMSHLACSEEKEHPLNRQQLERFRSFVQGKEGRKSILNSAGIVHFPEYAYDYIRSGLALYGASPIPEKSAQELGLKPVMTVQSSLISIQNLTKGTAIGYGGTYVCPEDMPVGIVAFGYGDGYSRTAKNGTPVLVNGTICPLVGRVSMDMLAVDLRPCPNAQVLDPVILWGERLPLEKVIEHMSVVPYDLLCGIQNRLKFLWIRPE